jgi:hypothetical protein
MKWIKNNNLILQTLTPDEPPEYNNEVMRTEDKDSFWDVIEKMRLEEYKYLFIILDKYSEYNNWRG